MAVKFSYKLLSSCSCQKVKNRSLIELFYCCTVPMVRVYDIEILAGQLFDREPPLFFLCV
jgi:hypothetical protein